MIMLMLTGIEGIGIKIIINCVKIERMKFVFLLTLSSELVEKYGDKTFVHTSVKNDNFVAPIPSNIVFVVSDKSLPDQKSINIDEAKKYFSSLNGSNLIIE